MARVLSGFEWLGVRRGVLVKYMRRCYVETGCECFYESFVSIPYLPSLCPQSTTLQLQVDSCETSAKTIKQESSVQNIESRMTA